MKFNQRLEDEKEQPCVDQKGVYQAKGQMPSGQRSIVFSREEEKNSGAGGMQ